MIGDLAQLFVYCLLISAATFGGGSQALFYQYGVLQTGWISKTDLSAILSFGYATPGPAVFGTATFIGYRMGGIPGAFVGTVGIFIIPFLAAFVAAKFFQHLLVNTHARTTIKGIGLAATGIVAATALSMLHIGSAAAWQIIIAAAAFAISLKWKVNPLFVLAGGLAIGLIISYA